MSGSLKTTQLTVMIERTTRPHVVSIIISFFVSLYSFITVTLNICGNTAVAG